MWQPHLSSETGIEMMEVLAKPHSEGDVIGGAFVGFVPQQKEDETVLYEDGC